MHYFLNKEFLPAEKTFVHVSDLAIQRGYGIFDFFKIVNGRPLFIEDYFDRLYRSAEVMRLPVPFSREHLKEIIFELNEKNGLTDSGIKIILTGGYAADGYEIATPNLIITQQPLTLPNTAALGNGIKIITHEYVRDIPQVKTINYTMGIWLQQKIKDAQAADVLYHWNGVVSEFPRCNLFIVKADGTVVTPVENILQGITRKKILSMNEKNFTVREGTVTLEEVLAAREVFLTSTTKRIIPIVRVDGKTISNGKPGNVSLRILKALVEMEKEY